MCVHNDLAFLVMPLLDGTTLQDYVTQRGRPSYAETSELLQQIGAGLAFAHDRGIVHGDIKPSNILLERATGRWLLTDFAIAGAAPGGETDRAEQLEAATAYRPSDQRSGPGEVDRRVDLYSFAATLLFALAGDRPNLESDRDELARWLHDE